MAAAALVAGVVAAQGAGSRAIPAGSHGVPVLIALRSGGHANEAERAISARGTATRVRERLARAGFRETFRFSTLHALAGEIQGGDLRAALSDPEVVGVDPDTGGGGGLRESVPLVGARALQDAGVTGRGVTVAVLDSGIDASHPDLGDDLVDEQCFCRNQDGTGCCPGGLFQSSGPGAARDDYGHGSWVSGVVTSAGRVAPRGVAPDAGILAIKVLDAQNRFAASAQILAGLDWVLAARPDVRVVNMSLGTDELFEGRCDTSRSWTMAYAEAIGALRRRGVLVVAASMNSGSARRMAAPACVASALAVGATYDARHGALDWGTCRDAAGRADQLVCFSNGGRGLDLLAPGALIVTTAPGGGRTRALGGTSFAAPHVAGAAALLLELSPSLTPGRIEAALETTGPRVRDARSGFVFPRLDVRAAAAAVSAREYTVLLPPESAGRP